MIINRQGAKFEYEGVTYTIGGAIVGTAESEYEGLYGRINTIHDGDDKETENETPDIYCEFAPPVMPDEIKALEETFSDLYDQPKTLDDIILDMVIMAPSMIRPLDDLHAVRKQTPVYVVMEDWAVDGEHGSSCELFTDYEDARRIMISKLQEELENGAIPRWANSGAFIVDSSKDSYEGYIDGEYMEDHYSISILTQPLTMSSKHIREMAALEVKEEEQKDPLLAFIEQEVPFRLHDIFDWLPEEIITSDVIDQCIDALWSDTNVMFAYDSIDDVITKELENLGITPESIAREETQK